MKLLDIELRGWVTIGLFAMSFYVLTLMAFVPGLRDDEFFKTIGTLILGSGGLLFCVNFVYGGSKATNSAIETVNDMAKRAPPLQADKVNVEADKVEVKEKS